MTATIGEYNRRLDAKLMRLHIRAWVFPCLRISKTKYLQEGQAPLRAPCKLCFQI